MVLDRIIRRRLYRQRHGEVFAHGCNDLVPTSICAIVDRPGTDLIFVRGTLDSYASLLSFSLGYPTLATLVACHI